MVEAHAGTETALMRTIAEVPETTTEAEVAAGIAHDLGAPTDTIVHGEESVAIAITLMAVDNTNAVEDATMNDPRAPQSVKALHPLQKMNAISAPCLSNNWPLV